jgi:hypothetical protein
MENLPSEVLIHTFTFLTIREVFSSLPLVNKHINSLTTSPHLLHYQIFNTCSLSFFPTTSVSQSKQILKTASSADSKRLEFFGFLTSGGVDENMMKYWVSNLFTSEGEAYCAHDDSENSVSAGVLLGCMADPRSYFTCEADLQNAIEIFNQGQEMSPFLLMAMKEALIYLGKRNSLAVLIDQVEEKCGFKIPQLANVRRFSGNDYVLEEKIEIERAEKSGFMGVIKKIRVSRAGMFTCPVKELIVFVSEAFVDVLDPEFAVYNDVKHANKLQQVLESDESFPDIHIHADMNNYEYCEMSPRTTRKVKPIFWIKFKQGDTATIRLSHVFVGKYLYVKLIRPSDKRHGAHADMNIDCRFVQPYGSIINLGSEL